MQRTLPLPFVLLCLAACAAPAGRVPASLIDLYDHAAPGGLIELEIDRDGSIREMEAEIPVADLPEGLRAAALERLPGARITGAEREIVGDVTGYEVQLVHEGRNWELVYSEDGELLESERELTRDEWPSAVVQAADQRVPGGLLLSVELIERLDDAMYHVKKEKDGARHKLVIEASGAVVRHVRETPAEIEIPID